MRFRIRVWSRSTWARSTFEHGYGLNHQSVGDWSHHLEGGYGAMRHPDVKRNPPGHISKVGWGIWKTTSSENPEVQGDIFLIESKSQHPKSEGKGLES